MLVVKYKNHELMLFSFHIVNPCVGNCVCCKRWPFLDVFVTKVMLISYYDSLLLFPSKIMLQVCMLWYGPWLEHPCLRNVKSQIFLEGAVIIVNGDCFTNMVSFAYHCFHNKNQYFVVSVNNGILLACDCQFCYLNISLHIYLAFIAKNGLH